MRSEELANILKPKLPHKLSVFLPYEGLRESVCRHLCCRTPLYIESSLLYLLPYPHLMGVYMPQLRVKPLVFLFNDSDRLLIVAVDRWLNLWIELNVLKDAGPPLHLSSSC